jgi:hypothetical protein
MRRKRFIALSPLFLALPLFVLLLVPLAISAMNEKCGERDDAVQNTCKFVKYRELPPGLKGLMAKMKCNVKIGSSYDYGYAVDLNRDGRPKYAFCCKEAGHGPCGMTIFGTSSGKWKVLYNNMLGFTDGKTPCFGFVALRENTQVTTMFVKIKAEGI